MAEETLWFSPADVRPVSSTVTLTATAAEVDVQSSATGPNQWIAFPLALPAGAALVQMQLCYQVTDARTSIAQVRITGVREPGNVTTLAGDTNTRNSTTAVCETIDLRAAGKPVPATPALTL